MNKIEIIFLNNAKQVPEEFQKNVVALDIKTYLMLEEAGMQVQVPDIFYDIDTYNRISLAIYQALLDCFEECKILLEEQTESKYLNLVALFFHEIIVIACSYYFKKCEIAYIEDHSCSKRVAYYSDKKTLPPFISYEFTLNTANKTSPKQILKEVLRSLFYRYNFYKSSLDLSGNKRNTYNIIFSRNILGSVPLIYKYILEYNRNGKWIPLLLQNNQQIYIPLVEKQIIILKRHINMLSKTSDLRSNKPFDNLALWIESWIKQFVVNDHRVNNLNGHVLLTGSPVEIDVRLAAAKAKYQGIPVLSVFHGDSYGVLDEPVFGYGEHTYTDYLIGYGNERRNSIVKSQFLKSLFPGEVSYMPSTSNKVNDIITERSILKINDIQDLKIMYVPTLLSGSVRYGPFRDVHDIAYFNWQRELLKHFSEKTLKPILWKRHKGDKIKYETILPNVEMERECSFEKLIGNADVFIFDYISTAFTLAAATSKPIIYFDVGLRNPTPEALEAIKTRCIYVKANLKKPAEAFSKFYNIKGKKCLNTYSRKFSLTKDRKKREQTIAEELVNIVTREKADIKEKGI